MSRSLTYAGTYLREHDRDRYLASLFMAPPAREAVQALYAFNADVATVRDRAHQPAPGEVRLQWWADAMAGEGHGEVRKNPLAAALLDAVDNYRLPTGPLLRLIEARRFDLYDDPMPDVPSFEGYAGETVSVLYQLAAMVLNGGEELPTGDAAGHLGVAHALIGHLRAFGHNAARGRLFLPWSVFAANGVREGEIFSGTISEGLLAARAQLTDMAREHLDAAAPAIGALPPRLRPAFAPAAVLRRQLQAVAAQEEAPFTPPPEPGDWRKLLAMLVWVGRQRR